MGGIFLLFSKNLKEEEKLVFGWILFNFLDFRSALTSEYHISTTSRTSPDT